MQQELIKSLDLTREMILECQEGYQVNNYYGKVFFYQDKGWYSFSYTNQSEHTEVWIDEKKGIVKIEVSNADTLTQEGLFEWANLVRLECAEGIAQEVAARHEDVVEAASTGN